QGGGQYQSGVCVSSHAASGGHSQSWAQWIRWLPIRRGSPSGSPEPCAQHVHGLQGNSYWISSCLILSRVEVSTKPGAIHPVSGSYEARDTALSQFGSIAQPSRSAAGCGDGRTPVSDRIGTPSECSAER